MANITARLCRAVRRDTVNSEALLMRFVLYFGYEEPWQQKSNHSFGGDAESVGFCLVEASSESLATELGRQAADQFVANLYKTAGVVLAVPWGNSDYAVWGEEIDERRWDAMKESASTIVAAR